MTTTLDTVAALAGVSRQTVSNALHHPDRLRAETRERVLEAVRRSGYRPSLPARQLATRRASAIAVRADPQQDGVTRVLMHSVTWQYLPPETQARITAAMEAAGARATESAPLAWVTMEPDRDLSAHRISVRMWPDGAPARMIGSAHAHARWVERS